MRTEVRSVDLSSGVTLDYGERGRSDGVPTLLLPGFSDSWHSFDRVLPHLPESLRIFALSQRGHGDSSRPEHGYRIRDFAGDVVAFLDAHELEKAVLVGHSMGSSVAQRVAIDAPSRTSGIVLANGVYSRPDRDAMDDLRSKLSSMEDPMDPEFVRNFLQGTVTRSVPKEFFEKSVAESLKLPTWVWRAVLREGLEEDSSAELDRIRAPTLLIWGDRDEIAARDEQEAQLQAIPNSRLIVYEGVGHSVPWEAPERFADDIADFVESLVD